MVALRVQALDLEAAANRAVAEIGAVVPAWQLLWPTVTKLKKQIEAARHSATIPLNAWVGTYSTLVKQPVYILAPTYLQYRIFSN